ncbi:MAG: hypothetical protein LBM77_10820 [Spirochaetaceae bacterium]|jgi:hypothetical protein|nr:hypothetical protein [Spirochaetaceae bacterium]
MANQNEERQAIKAYQGRLFKVAFTSHFGSSNVGWVLTSLPKGIALLAEETLPSEKGNTTVIQTFYFSALDADKPQKELEFRLVAHLPTIDKEAQKQTVTIKVLVVPYDENAEGIGKDRFVEYCDNKAVYGDASDDCTQVLKYGYPPYMKYGYPASVVKYGYPGCEVPAEAVIPYGYVGQTEKYGYPSRDAACEVYIDDCGCPIVKYGYPTIKYGYPSCK